jgi:hypothetical protein
MLASQGGYADVVKFLLASKADVNAKVEGGESALHYAAANGHQDVAKLLLAGRANASAVDSRGQTPLHWAALMGNTDLVGLLLASHAQVNAKSSAGLTPLHFAAAGQALMGNGSDDSKDRVATIRLLLRSKADATVENQNLVSPLALAFLAGNRAVAGELATAMGYKILSLNEDKLITDRDWQEVYHCGEPPSTGLSLSIAGSPTVVLISYRNVYVSGNMRPMGFSGVTKIGRVLLSGEAEYPPELVGLRVKSGASIAYPGH